MQTTTLKPSPRLMGILSGPATDKPNCHLFRNWIEKRREHHQVKTRLARLRAQPGYLLRDIGLSRDDIRLVRNGEDLKL